MGVGWEHTANEMGKVALISFSVNRSIRAVFKGKGLRPPDE